MFVMHFAEKAVYITNKVEHFSFKSGRPMWIEKLTKEDYSVAVRISTKNLYTTLKSYITKVLTTELNFYVFLSGKSLLT